jgi:hypothetical protein
MPQTVTRETFFHINSNANASPYRLMQVGDVIDVGSQSNPFFRFYEVHKRTYPVTDSATKEVYQVPAMKFLSLAQEGTITSSTLPKIARDTANHFLMLARELFWENVRLSEYPDAPSRQRCIWLITSIEDTKAWLKTLKFQPPAYSVVRLCVSGRALHVDGSFLAGDSEPLPVWAEKSRAYWSGKQSSSPQQEVLFEGRVEVLEVIDPAILRTSSPNQ